MSVDINQVKAFLFDLDGVIVDTARYHYLAWRRLAHQLGFEFTEEQNEALKGISRMDSLEIVLSVGKVTLSASDKVKYAAEKNAYYLELCSQMTPGEVLPGVMGFLEEARAKGIRIGLGSASKNARTILDTIGITQLFDAIVDGNRVINSKPDPEVFLIGAKELHAKPEECVVFEDAAAGIEAARRAEMKSVGVGDPGVLGAADCVIPGFEGLTIHRILADL
jgi:beta-phosphoglucomutase